MPSRRWRHLAVVLVCGLSALALTSCAGEDQQGSPAHRMSEWVSNGSGFGQDVATLHADNTRIDTVIRLHHGTGAIHADCSLLVTDAETANDELPTPDESATTLLYAAYGLEGAAGANCYKAGATDPALLAKSAAERAKGWAMIEKAYKQIEGIVGGPVSTTTTTDAGGGSIFG